VTESLDYQALLDLSRLEANREFELTWPAAVRPELEHLRKKLVVRKFLERICPVDVPEAQSILNNQAGSSDR
jgi:hypothetical protein